MTNPDNVGGLNDHKPVPLSEELRIEAAMISGDVYVRGDAFVARMTRMAEQAERLEELCRAAPAGGDYPNEADGLALELVSVTEERDSLRRRVAELSAPAGSGEVEQMAKRLDDARAIEEETSGLEDTIDAMRTAAALLRKLQQGAEYSPNSVAKRKRVEIEAQGYVCNGVSFMHPETGRRGLLDDLGAVHWIASQGQEGGTNE